YLFMNGANNSNDSALQQIAIPATANSVNLTFFLNVTTNETTTTTQHDQLFVEVLDPSGNVLATLATFSNLDATTAGNYSQKGLFDLSGFRGQTVGIRFRGTNDSSLSTRFRIDDVSVTAAGGGSHELIVNGSFENGTAPWTLTGGAAIGTTFPHTGTHYLFMNGVNNSTNSALQQIAIPATANSVNLTFFLNVTTNETTTTTQHDQLFVEVLDPSGNVLATLATFSNLDATTAGN